jgi:tRNA(Ile2) C34 agmatinyltransferase TiaS
MNLVTEVRKLARYLLGKKSELEDLDLKDGVMAKTILDIHRKKTSKEIVSVPLHDLRQIHRLDRENAIEATQRRVEILVSHRTELIEAGALTCETLARVLPSVSWIKGVRKSAEEVLAFEGNGRIAAMQTVFGPEDGMTVEIEEYRFRNPAKIIRRLDRVRRMNGLLEGEAANER